MKLIAIIVLISSLVIGAITIPKFSSYSRRMKTNSNIADLANKPFPSPTPQAFVASSPIPGDSSAMMISIGGTFSLELQNPQKIVLAKGESESITDDVDHTSSSPVSTVLYYQKPANGTYYVVVRNLSGKVDDTMELFLNDRNAESSKITEQVTLSPMQKGIYKLIFNKDDLSHISIEKVTSF